MANNYLEYSAFLEIPSDKIEQARAIVARKIAKLEDDDEWGYCGTCADVEERGVWFHAEESGNTDHVEAIAKALLEELEIDNPFCCSWAYTCSKPRIDEFGGGAMVVRRGHETVWVDALDQAKAIAAGVGKETHSALAVLRKLEDVISGIEAEADNAGIDLEEARHWWREAAKILAHADTGNGATPIPSLS